MEDKYEPDDDSYYPRKKRKTNIQTGHVLDSTNPKKKRKHTPIIQVQPQLEIPQWLKDWPKSSKE